MNKFPTGQSASSDVRYARALTEGSISLGLLRFTLPILGTNVLQSVSSSASTVWVGRYLGEAELTAVSNAQALTFLLTGAALGISMAAMVMLGQRMGAGNITEAKRVIGTSATFFAAISIAMAVAGLMLSKWLLVSMGVPLESLSAAVAYMKVIFVALPSVYMCSFLMSVVLCAGDSKTPLCFMLLSVAINIVLSPILIFGLGPLPRLGVAGSAFATLLAQSVSLVALTIHLYRRRHPLCLHRDDLAMLRIDMAILRALVSKGIPMGAQLLVVSLSGTLMIVLVNRFGVDVIAAFGVSAQLWVYLQMPAIAVSMAVAAMAALNVGGGQWERVRSIARVGVFYSIVLTGCTVLTLYALDVHLYRLFLPVDSPALVIASRINAIVAWSFVLVGVSSVLFGVVRAAGVVMAPLFIQILSLLAVRFPLAAMLLDRWGADAIWWSFPVSAALSVVLAVLYFRYGRWRTQRQRILTPSQVAPSSLVDP